jgi:hypothetical protein
MSLHRVTLFGSLIVLAFLAASVLAQSPATATKAAEPKAGAADDWQSLFDGVSLEGWTPNEHKESVKVADGAIVVGGERTHVFYTGKVGDHDFKNFQFKAKVKTEPKANSGIYFHTKYQADGWPEKGYEAQVNNSGPDPQKTGSLYGVVPVTEAPAKDNEWFDYEITVEGNHVTITIDGKKVVDFIDKGDEMPHLKEFPGRRLDRGTFALQVHDPGSVVHYKDIQVKKLP